MAGGSPPVSSVPVTFNPALSLAGAVAVVDGVTSTIASLPDVPVGVADVALPPEGSDNAPLTDALVGTVTTGSAVPSSAEGITSHGGEIACPPEATNPGVGVGSVGSPRFSSLLLDFVKTQEGLAASRASKNGWFIEGLEEVILVIDDSECYCCL